MFYILEHQVRPDGVVNTLAEVARTTFAMAYSYFYDRCSKMSANEQFMSVHIMLVDDKLAVVDKKDIVTSYVEPAAPSEEAE